jgi:hypothetical protein
MQSCSHSILIFFNPSGGGGERSCRSLAFDKLQHTDYSCFQVIAPCAVVIMPFFSGQCPLLRLVSMPSVVGIAPCCMRLVSMPYCNGHRPLLKLPSATMSSVSLACDCPKLVDHYHWCTLCCHPVFPSLLSSASYFLVVISFPFLCCHQLPLSLLHQLPLFFLLSWLIDHYHHYHWCTLCCHQVSLLCCHLLPISLL